MLKIDKSKDHSFPKNEDQWVRFVNELTTSALSERVQLEVQWARNFAYYFGFQHLLYDPALKFIQIDNGRNDEYIINRIASFVEQRLAKLTRSKPILAVLPDKTDPYTIKAADISEKLLRNLWKINEKDEKLETAVLSSILCGSAFKKVMWNPKGGEGLRDDQDPEGNILFDEGGRKTQYLYFLGEIENWARSAFDILVAGGAKKIDSAPWVEDRQIQTVDEVKATFKEFDIDRALRFGDETTPYEKFISSLGIGSPYAQSCISRGTTLSVKDLDLVMVKEWWMKPNRIYEEGVLITVVGDQLLQFESWPHEHKRYPFIKIDEHTNPAGFYGLSTVTRLIPIQQHYNQARTQISKNAQLMANAKWWAALGCGLSSESLTDEEGEVVMTNGNMARPEQIGVAPLPNYVMENQNQDILDIRDVGGERSVDQQPFTGLTAGIAIETMAELSDIGLGPTIKNIERGCVKEGQIELFLANEYYTDERTIKVVGEQKGQISVLIFKNTDLMYQTDVTIQLESGFAKSLAGTRQTLIDMWDRRIIYDPEMFMKAYASGNIETLMKAKDPAEAVVLEDIEMLKQGAMPPVQPFDNHIVYIRLLSEFIQTPEFRKMPPDRQMIAMQVLQAHIQFVQPAQPEPEQNQAAVNTPYGEQVTT